jgi:menaquinone-specific isochorismate synthase
MTDGQDFPCPDPGTFFERASEQTSCSFFWKGRDEEATWMGFGGAAKLSSMTDCPEALKKIALGDAPFAPRAFCAVPFDGDFRPLALWESFPSRLFVVPQVLVRWTRNRASLLSLGSEAETDTWREILSQSPVGAPRRPSVRTVLQTQRGEWRRMLSEVQAELKQGALRKVVLVRCMSAFSDEPISAAAVLTGLLAQEGCSVFAFRSGKDVFLGASPERLFALEGNKLITESLAGTHPRGRTEREDRKLAEALLASEKERREHDIVREFITARLNSLCSDHETETPAVRKLDTVQHLYTTLRGVLRAGVGPDQVLEELHPTPAVCGDPRDTARKLISRLEATPRGYYTGAIGWTNGDHTEMAVAIRCGLIKGRRAVVFAGAGIVAGSNADAEWDETENKMKPFLQALGGSGA